MRILIAIAFAAAAGACYSPALGRCSVECEGDGVCPPGGTCGLDGFCHVDGEDEDCNASVVMHQLTITVVGDGSISGVNGLACNDECTVMLPTGDYELAAVPSSTSRLGSWQVNNQAAIDCGTSEVCLVNVSSTTTVRAEFEPAAVVTLAFTGDGHGHVVSSPAGVDCEETTNPCIGRFAPGSDVTLAMTVGMTSVFVEWTGDCQGSGTTCSLGMLDATSLPQVFANLDATRLTLVALPANVGTIRIGGQTPCPDLCEMEVRPNSMNNIPVDAAITDTNFKFDHWVNVCNDGVLPSCLEIFTADRLVVALFEPKASVQVNVDSLATVEIRANGMHVRDCGGSQQPIGACRAFLDPGAAVELEITMSPGSGMALKEWDTCPTGSAESAKICPFSIVNNETIVVSPSFKPVVNPPEFQ